MAKAIPFYVLPKLKDIKEGGVHIQSHNTDYNTVDVRWKSTLPCKMCDVKVTIVKVTLPFDKSPD